MLKISTIEELRNNGIVKFIECDKSERDNGVDVLRDTKTNTYYKIPQTLEEVQIEILARCLSYLRTISSILVSFLIIFILTMIFKLSLLF